MYQCMACKRLVEETQEGPIRNDALCKECAKDYEEGEIEPEWSDPYSDSFYSNNDF